METDPNYEYEAPKWFDFTGDFESELNDARWGFWAEFILDWIEITKSLNKSSVAFVLFKRLKEN